MEGNLIPFSEAISPFSAPMTLDEAKMRHELIRRFCFEVLKEGTDYGIIPGTGKIDPKTGEETGKKVLQKPGAEKLCQLMNVHPKFGGVKVVEDFDKPLFFYRYECQLVHNGSGLVVGTGIGSCNSYESKYRWRQSNRQCPNCGKETIIKGKDEYGGGWLCYLKKGGCGSKWADGDTFIEGQNTARIENPDIFDLINTIDKMAQKRALLAPVLILAGVSEYFTQDMDDLEPEKTGAAYGAGSAPVEPREVPPSRDPAPKKARQDSAGAPDAADPEKKEPASGSSFESTTYRISLVKKIKEIQKYHLKNDTLDEIASIVFCAPKTFSDINKINDLTILTAAIAQCDQILGGKING